MTRKTRQKMKRNENEEIRERSKTKITRSGNNEERKE